VYWTFDDDYASCGGLCPPRARYQKVDDAYWDWTWLTPETDPGYNWYAYTTLPAGSLEAGAYRFQFDVRDCAGQYKFPPHYYYFTVP